ncbi:hypothetical protein MKX01_033544 [Papaver californicum]|nr:hypothetical protein MKX01_033544 [Papaver californicum]
MYLMQKISVSQYQFDMTHVFINLPKNNVSESLLPYFPPYFSSRRKLFLNMLRRLPFKNNASTVPGASMHNAEDELVIVNNVEDFSTACDPIGVNDAGAVSTVDGDDLAADTNRAAVGADDLAGGGTTQISDIVRDDLAVITNKPFDDA